MIKSDLQNITVSICLTWQYPGNKQEMGKSESEWDKRRENSHHSWCYSATGQLDSPMFSDQHITRFQGWLRQSLMGSGVGRGWGGLGRAAGPVSQGEAMLSFQTKHGPAERLWTVRWSPGLALSPLLSTCVTLSKLLSFSEFFSSSGKWDKEWQFLVNRLIVKLSSWWNGVWNTMWYAFSPSSS